jgi:hypothetical protein
MSLGLDTVLRRNGEILHASVSTEEAVMMSVAAGKYYGLNSVGARIWELLETPKSIAQLCAQIEDEFEVDTATCETTVLKFAGDLVDHGIVDVSGA